MTGPLSELKAWIRNDETPPNGRMSDKRNAQAVSSPKGEKLAEKRRSEPQEKYAQICNKLKLFDITC